MTTSEATAQTESDVIVIGSGAGGVHASWPLTERGLNVTLLDYGNEDRSYAPLIPERPWAELRTTDANQHRYFLGERFEGIPFGKVKVGAQLTPPRHFIAADTERLLPVESDTFSVTESLARGGLAAGWGAGVFPFDDHDLAGTPFTGSALEQHYDAVAERIGVCGPRDDLLPILGDCAALQDPLEIDNAAARVLERYRRRRTHLHERGFRLGHTRLAVCTREHRGRGPHAYHDMEFWSDSARSVYRAQWTLAELEAFDNFRYLNRRLALSFHEDSSGDCVEVRCLRADGGEERHRARRLILAAGALGSARIALRSLERYGKPVGLLCNPYTYAPVLNFGALGDEPKERRHSLAQLTAVYTPSKRNSEDERRPPVLAQYYSYRSLLLFKLMKESPLPYRETLGLMRLLQPVLGIIGIHHADRPTDRKTCTLVRSRDDEASAGAPDRLRLDYALDPEEERTQASIERELLSIFRRLGCWSLRRIRPGHGANIHYAGTLPFSSSERELTCDARGRLRGTRGVYVADGAAFPALPAKGLTFTIMAHADRVGTGLADELIRRAAR